MKKLIRNGKVAVLVSYGYGAGWSTWNQKYGDEVVFAPEIIELVERNASFAEIEAKAIELWGDEFFCDGIKGLTVVWIPKNTKFVITDYDGAESIITDFLEA